ncbi:acyl-CoA N-acyltransferase [Neohortaea acidophila]|uniref:Acyl-CoA N-acyltransferase n=1 Tax=Neohortaea acidophila TaxID=245834 RepID=A0A6A6PXS7_9PEZI|nr:acyl-CoA N-acyltransferase [Neohortaea acidophila]KAF2484815.1 acyl-CoA N-acyltransferase [Neohortaea acidophila]
MTNLWASPRLIYCALERGEHDSLLAELDSDPEGFMNVSSELPSPQGKKDVADWYEHLEKQMLACAVCLPPPPVTNGAGSAPKPIPIGCISLKGLAPRMLQHRMSDLTIRILRQYRGQGYGPEAMEWALNWGFDFAGLHRIQLMVYAYNADAARLYEKMGFVREGAKRECVFVKGRFWDVLQYSMLEHEWRARQKK